MYTQLKNIQVAIESINGFFSSFLFLVEIFKFRFVYLFCQFIFREQKTKKAIISVSQRGIEEESKMHTPKMKHIDVEYAVATKRINERRERIKMKCKSPFCTKAFHVLCLCVPCVCSCICAFDFIPPSTNFCVLFTLFFC